MKETFINDCLLEINKLAIDDSQISANGIFTDFTDFQNIMLSNFSLLELLWEGHENELEQKKYWGVIFRMFKIK